MVVRIHQTLAERTARYVPGHIQTDVDWSRGAVTYRDHDGSAPMPGDLPNRQGVHVVRRGRLVRLHDIAPESERQYFDADDVVEEPTTSARVDRRHADDSAVPGLVGFITDADRRAEGKKKAAADKRDGKAKKRIEAAARRTEREATLSPAERAARQNRRERFAEVIAQQNADVSDQRRNGFSFKGGWIAGRYYPAFTEYFGDNVGRTDLHPLFKLFWSTIPVDCRVGVDKTYVEKTHSKQLAGNFPYIEGDAKHCRWIFKEIDGAVFESPEACRAALAEIFTIDPAFAGEGIDMVPNLVMGHTREDGTFEAGHLVWMFKPGASVWTDLPGKGVDRDGNEITWGDPRCQSKPVAALERTRDSLCQLLLPIGGDPGQTNHRKPKSPISPFMTVLIANESNLFELADFPKIKNYPLKTNKEAMYRDAEIYRARTEGVSETLSMKRFNTCKDIASAVTKRARIECEPAFLAAQAASIAAKSPAVLAAWVEREVRVRIAATDLEPGAGLDRCIRDRAVFAARLYMKPKTARRRQAIRGRDRDYVVTLTKLPAPPVAPDLPVSDRVRNERRVKKCIRKARQKESGRRSAAKNAAKTLWRFKENVVTWFRQGGADDLATFLRDGLWSVCAKTAKKYWEQVSAEFSPSRKNGAKRYIACPTSGQTVRPQPVPAMLRTNEPTPIVFVQPFRQFVDDDPHPDNRTSGPPTARRNGQPCPMAFLVIPDHVPVSVGA